MTAKVCLRCGGRVFTKTVKPLQPTVVERRRKIPVR